MDAQIDVVPAKRVAAARRAERDRLAKETWGEMKGFAADVLSKDHRREQLQERTHSPPHRSPEEEKEEGEASEIHERYTTGKHSEEEEEEEARGVHEGYTTGKQSEEEAAVFLQRRAARAAETAALEAEMDERLTSDPFWSVAEN